MSLSSPTSEQKAYAKCLRLLSSRDHSRAELERRLTADGYDCHIREQVLGKLTRTGLVNDTHFAQEWVETRRRRSGKTGIVLAQELRAKGIDEDLITEAIETDVDSERARACQLVEKYFPKGSFPDHMKLTRRLVGMLVRRGYSPSLAYEVVHQRLHADHQ